MKSPKKFTSLQSSPKKKKSIGGFTSLPSSYKVPKKHIVYRNPKNSTSPLAAKKKSSPLSKKISVINKNQECILVCKNHPNPSYKPIVYH